MTVDQRFGVVGTVMTPPTSSGARIGRAQLRNVAGYLSRHGAPSDSSEHAGGWGAFETDGCQVGVAVPDPVTRTRALGFIGVSPERRRLRVGADLLAIGLDEAGAIGMAWLVGSHHAEANEVRRLVRARGRTAA